MMAFVGTHIKIKWLLLLVKDFVHEKEFRFQKKKESDLIKPEEGIWREHKVEDRKHFQSRKCCKAF